MSNDEMDKVMQSAQLRWIAAIVLGVACVAGYVIVIVFLPSHDATQAGGIFTFGATFSVLIGLSGQIDKTNAKADDIAQRVSNVESNTNGKLTQHIDTVATLAANKALDAAATKSDITKLNGK